MSMVWRSSSTSRPWARVSDANSQSEVIVRNIQQARRLMSFRGGSGSNLPEEWLNPGGVQGVSCNMHRNRAFTLIELMVVVAIMSLIAAVLIPSFLRARDRSRANPPIVNSGEIAERVPELKEPPDIDHLVARMKLTDWTTRKGMEVTNRYRLHCQGQLRVSGRHLRLPFPEGTEEASEVELSGEAGLQWKVRPWGIEAELSAGVHQLQYQFLAQGRDRVLLPLPPNGRLGKLDLELVAQGPGLQLNEESLQPVDAQDGVYRWQRSNLLTHSPLILDLPGSHSLTGKVLSLCRLAGVAVLLFGLGFWYLGELHRPGCLARFTWGHFFLLALTYSTFFPALSILSLSQGYPLDRALAVAALFSQPLLFLHCWRSLNFRFSAFYVLPLSLVTLAAVVNGVFGEDWRELNFLGALFGVVAFVTLTYPRWSANRARYQSSLREAMRLRAQDLMVRAEGRNLSLSGLPEQVETWSLDLLESRLSSLERDLEKQNRSTSPAATHCLACGRSGERTSFCGHCGERQALHLACGCGTGLWLAGPHKGAIHCPQCGGRHCTSLKPGD